MRVKWLSKKEIKALADKRDEEAKAKAEREKAEKANAETQEDILKDIRELLRSAAEGKTDQSADKQSD